jgi:hypothetical protein
MSAAAARASLFSFADRQIMEALVRLASDGRKVLARTIADELGNCSPMFVGRRLGALKRRGFVDSVYPSVESAGVPLVWWPTEAGVGATATVTGEPLPNAICEDSSAGHLEAAVQLAETALSDANERGNAAAIQRAETRLSNANERLDRYRGKGVRTV